MFNASQLSESQQQKIAEWAAVGAQLSDIQKKIQDDFGMPITYLDTRFLVLDLGIELQSVQPEIVVETASVTKVPTGFVDATVDEVERPGALKSGTVIFSDGEKARWMIDQMGRLSLDADTLDYHPNEEDLIQFQEKLRNLLI